ncbi:MAG: VIT1/CCC1 transporter family protein [Minisyncoccia bacterium]
MKFLIKKYLPEFVYGSVDGVVTTVAIITGAVGAGLSSSIILVLGLANVLADGFSMGSSEYLSSISEAQLDSSKKGLAKNTAFAKGLATFVSFVAVGLAPVVPFLVSVLVPGFSAYGVTVSLVTAFCAFIFIGYVGARVTKTSRLTNIIRTVAVGGVAAFISFAVGYLLRNIA